MRRQGLNKSETAAKYGEEQVKIWRRSEKLSKEEVVELNIPTGIPIVYQFDHDMNLLEKRYIGDPAVIEAKVDQVANQGKAR